MLILLVSSLALAATLQTPSASASGGAEQISVVENLLERGDYKRAEPLLKQLATAHPGDARLLFDLGFTQEHNEEQDAAVNSYQASIAADPHLAEPQVALGLLEARAGQTVAARGHLQAAAALPSIDPALHARALRAMAKLDQTGNTAAARDELAQAIQLTGEQPGDAQLTGALATAAGQTADAESSYRSALARDPHDLEAALGLCSLLQREGKLADADALLTPLLEAHRNDPRVVAQAATMFTAEGKTPEALALMQELRANQPDAANDNALTRLYAHLLLVSGDAVQAEPLYRRLVEAAPGDPALLDELGSVLVREQKFTDAQAVLTKAVALRAAFPDPAAWGDTAGHLAFAASRNHQPQVVLQALAARATVLPNSPATLFLEATAHDTLHQTKEAERDYRAFLAMANGKLPDEEFEARHRLVALEHEH